MLCFVDIEHEKVLDDPNRRSNHLARRMEIKLTLEEISGEPCLVQRYPKLTAERLREWGITALFISGNGTDWIEYDEGGWSEMFQIIRAAELPILGFCGGLQLIGMAHGVDLGPVRRLREGEEDPDPQFQPGFYKERGYMPVRIAQPDPLFDGLDDSAVFMESHYWEVKEVPPGFVNLATTDECRIQTLKHNKKLVYGTQFHPEVHDDEHPAGRTLIANFLRLAGILV